MSARKDRIVLRRRRTSADRSVSSRHVPYQCCGTEDFFYAQNVRFRDTVQDIGFDSEMRQEVQRPKSFVGFPSAAMLGGMPSR
jgi:hypothetical protein